ncbi:2-amino-4-hydroxy-6-hydroxymethyldihydropteridine diphosphokinase [Methylomarinum sp. Ch1-1]|uniref:2-amino-4-hydroxy-6-hydroxymethyldihydropteridine pyrophosphokinase n=1 Tax=Methylomarinum roseum TaxID=3067653 RepID=A0AAU7NXR7_9GAMM
MNETGTITVLAYIGLGSNLNHPVEQIRSARCAIAALPGVEEAAFSSLYRSAPMGPQDQPDYINAAMAVRTGMTAMGLLRQLQTIENQHGRVRLERWGARTLDLDLLLFGEQQIKVPDLIVPHIGLAERAFVLYPLLEIAGPELHIPGQGFLQDLVEQCPADGLERLTS